MAGMIIDGKKVISASVMEVRSPYDGAVVDTTPLASEEQIDLALTIAVRGAARMKQTQGYQRFLWLRQAARLLEQRSDEFARVISREEGKILSEATFEVSRAAQTLELSAEEAKRIAGEGVPLDGAPGGANKLGMTLRVPCGVVVAITPFNYPLNLVAHKIGPALAAGNAVILKPASSTPLSGIKLVELLLEAGVPTDAIGVVTFRGGELGEKLVRDARVRKVSFTGSFEAGEKICRAAGMKRVTMELGSNAPLIVMDDADLNRVWKATVASGFTNAGQVCISTQRVLVDRSIHADFLDGLKPMVESLRTGNPLEQGVTLGPLINPQEAERVQDWIQEAVRDGARIVTGGSRDGSIHQPTILADVKPHMRVAKDELFGPAIGVVSFSSIDEAIAMANDSRYGLSAGIFTENLSRAMRFVRDVDAGNVNVNSGPSWRADLMPYGGLKDSGIGKEGPHYAIREMTEEKMVIFHL